MRAFYRFLAPLPEKGIPSGVVLHDDGVFVWVLAETSPAPDLEALGGQFRGHRLSELTPDDLDACGVVQVQRGKDADAERAALAPSTVQRTDTVLTPVAPRTIYAGDDVEDYR